MKDSQLVKARHGPLFETGSDRIYWFRKIPMRRFDIGSYAANTGSIAKRLVASPPSILVSSLHPKKCFVQGDNGAVQRKVRMTNLILQSAHGALQCRAV